MISSKSVPRGIIRDVALIAIGIVIIWAGLYAVFGMTNPFYVVASGSMIPELEVYDVLVVQGRIPFEDLVVGDVIVFDRPSDHNRVIVHRIVSITDEDPRTVRTKGDANRASIPGTDFPITSKEYIGKVEIVIPQVGYVTQALKPPVNYIIIVVILGVLVPKLLIQIKKNDDDKRLQQGPNEDNDGTDGRFRADIGNNTPGAYITTGPPDDAYTADDTPHAKDAPDDGENDTPKDGAKDAPDDGSDRGEKDAPEDGAKDAPDRGEKK